MSDTCVEMWRTCSVLCPGWSALGQAHICSLLNFQGQEWVTSHHKVLPSLLFTLCYLTVRSSCWSHNLCKLIIMEKLRCCPITSFAPLTSSHGDGRYFTCYWMRKWHHTTRNPVTCNTDLLARCTCTTVMGVTSHFLVGFKGHSMRWNPYPLLPKWPRTWD